MNRSRDGQFDYASTDLAPVHVALAKHELCKLCRMPAEKLTLEQRTWVMRLWREQVSWALPILKGEG